MPTFTTPETPDALRARLVGAWKLESYVAHAADASSKPATVYPMTKSVQGMLLYTPDGYLSAQMLIPGQPKIKATEARESDWAEIGRRYFAYSGPYYTTEEGGKIKLRHGMRIASRPDQLGQVELRDWRFEEDGRLLVLGSEEPTDFRGVMRRPELRWRKLDDNTDSGMTPPDSLD